MKNNNLTISVIGLGYIGLPTAALIASKKINVIGVDVNDHVIETINKGEIHIVEPDLEGLVNYVVKNEYLRAQKEVSTSDIFVVAVPTPFNGDKTPDLSYVEAAIKSIVPILEEGNTVIIESTSPVGTTEKMMNLIYSSRPELQDKISMAYCPERVLPGNVIHELEHNDRVVGGINTESSRRAKSFYQLFVKAQLLLTNAGTAEMCKLVENASRDANIAFANELSMICDEANIDVYELIKLANHHPRVNILKPGPGVGGHCIAVDPWFIVSEFPEQAKMIQLARNINDGKTDWVIRKIKKLASEFENIREKKPKIACLGLSFKPNIDDLRESPALSIVMELIKEGYDICAVEPNISSHNSLKISTLDEALSSADLVVYLVAHKEFKELEIGQNHHVFCDLS